MAAHPSLAHLIGPAGDDYDPDDVEGIGTATDKVLEFLRKKILQNPDIESDVRLVLCQAGQGTTETLKTFDFGPDDDAGTMAEQVVDFAASETRTLSYGKIRFRLTVENQKGVCTFALVLAKPDEDGINEAPNERGFVAQVMRHNEKNTSLAHDALKFVVTSVTTDNRDLRQQHAILQKQQFDFMQAMGAMWRGEKEIELRAQQSAASEKRKDELFGTFANIGVPYLMSKVIPGLKDAAPGPLEHMIVGLFKTFDPSQLEGILQGKLSLRDDQRLAVLHLLEGAEQVYQKNEGLRKAVDGSEEKARAAAEAERRRGEEAKKQESTNGAAGGEVHQAEVVVNGTKNGSTK